MVLPITARIGETRIHREPSYENLLILEFVYAMIEDLKYRKGATKTCKISPKGKNKIRSKVSLETSITHRVQQNTTLESSLGTDSLSAKFLTNGPTNNNYARSSNDCLRNRTKTWLNTVLPYMVLQDGFGIYVYKSSTYKPTKLVMVISSNSQDHPTLIVDRIIYANSRDTSAFSHAVRYRRSLPLLAAQKPQ